MMKILLRVGLRVARFAGRVPKQLMLALIVIMAMPHFASAATFTVNSTADVADKNIGDGECDTGNVVVINGERKPECTLRAAIIETNMNTPDPVPDTIILPALPTGPYRLTNGELNIGQSLSILGAGSAATIIDGMLSNSRVLHIVRPSGRARPTVQISGVTIQNGRELNGDGGAISIGVEARLVLRNCIITGNKTLGAGGGILTEGRLFIFDSTISDNDSETGGGGIANFGELFLSQSNIGGILPAFADVQLPADRAQRGNRNSSFGGGGGVLNSGGKITLEESTVSNNRSDAGGGTGGAGIFNSEGVLSITNSTISGNINTSGNGRGGGIDSFGGELFLFNVTITDNLTQLEGGGISAGGGGIVNLANTIIAGNFVGTRDVRNDCVGTLISQGFNLLGTDTNCPNFVKTTGDQVNKDPLLEPLKKNGGLTATHALLQGSPAINMGNPATPGGGFTCEVRDQRVLPRLNRCDIGAFEFGFINATGMLIEMREETSDPTPIPPSPAFPNGFPGGTVTFTLTFTNVGNVSIRNVVFEVTELSVKEIGSDFSLGGLLLNADAFRGRRGIGARISAPPNRVLSPGGVSIPQPFIIGRQTPNDSFNFAVDVLGVPLSR
jgi:CSLREA domain-containing protein